MTRLIGSFKSPKESMVFTLCLVSLWFAGMLAYDYYDRVELPHASKRMDMHREIVDGQAPYQYRYRVLLPNVADGLVRIFESQPNDSASYRRTFGFVYLGLNFCALAIMFFSMGLLFRDLFRIELALFGVAAAAGLTQFTFRDQYFHPWSFWEGAYFALGLLLIHRRAYWWVTALTVPALINRETSLFLILAFLACELPSGRGFRFALANLAVWSVGFLSLHQMIGYKPSTFFVETALQNNMTHLPYAVRLNSLLFGPVWILVLWGIRRAPPVLVRSSLMLPVYFGLLALIGHWFEIRYWIPILPIVLGGLIAAIEGLLSGERTRQLELRPSRKTLPKSA